MNASPPTAHQPAAPATDAVPVLFYDGECGLCNRTVRLLLALDRRGALRFAPLQGPNAQAYLRAHGLPTDDFDTMVLVPDWARRDRPEFLLRSDGVFAALRLCGSKRAAALAWLGWLPRALRDWGYRRVALNRYAIWGKWDTTCPLPKPEWRGRFWD